MNTLELSNVELSDKVIKEIASSPRKLTSVDKLIDPVVQRLAVLNPLWRFVISSAGYDNSTEPTSFKAVEFKVVEAGEELGTIGREYHGREHVISISNERIRSDRVRRGGYKTKDADKAILRAKKMFFKLKPNERIEKALGDAGKVIFTQMRLKERERHNAEGTVKAAALDYVMGTGFALFLEHLKTCTESERNKIEKHLSDKERLEDEMMTIETAKSAFEADKTALVIKDGGKYLVKIGDKIDLFDDNTLPDWMRGKLGMLKLVQAEQFVSNTGCRVNDETFVLMVEET
jgi:hypothetical protein